MKNAFCSKLNMKVSRDQDYEHAQQVWNIHLSSSRFYCYKMYLRFFEMFTTQQVGSSTLLLLLIWQVASQYTGIKLKLLRDYNKLLMFEKDIHGGITEPVH